MRLILAGFWALLGVGVLLLDLGTNNPNYQIRIGTGSFSLGWTTFAFALLLTFYNLARWWNDRSASPQRRGEIRARNRRSHSEPESAPDPHFDFATKPITPAENQPDSQ